MTLRVVLGYTQEGSSTLYFYRPWRYSGALSNIKIFVNSKEITTISNNSTTIWETDKTGRIIVGVKAWGCKMEEVEVNAKDKNSYFFIVGYTLTGIEINMVPYSSVEKKFPEIKKNEVETASTQQESEIVQQDKKTNSNSKFTSDIDINIPINENVSERNFALIIGNEDYSSHQVDLNAEINVDYARNDAKSFKEYALKTMGVPEKNIVFLLDATTGQMKQAIAKMNLIIKATGGQAEVFVYYAGHGLPDEETKEPYLIPVDVSGKNATDGIKLKDMYAKLTEFPAKKVTVFIDACFSGGARNQGLVAARGVKVKAKEEDLAGNIVVFSASSGIQSSLPLKEQKHGMFTYYLLKKLQETKGDVSYGELSKYLNENVSLQSVLVNDKEQTPQTNVSSEMLNEWENFKIK